MRYALMLLVLGFSTVLHAKEINIKVSGMVCSMCAQGIKKKFSQIKEVRGIEVNLDSKIVLVKTDGDQDITDEKIKGIITEAGYNVSTIERK